MYTSVHLSVSPDCGYNMTILTVLTPCYDNASNCEPDKVLLPKLCFVRAMRQVIATGPCCPP